MGTYHLIHFYKQKVIMIMLNKISHVLTLCTTKEHVILELQAQEQNVFLRYQNWANYFNGQHMKSYFSKLQLKVLKEIISSPRAQTKKSIS